MGSALIGRRKPAVAQPAPAGPRLPRVAILSPCIEQGGAERWMTSLGRYCDVDWAGCIVAEDRATFDITCKDLRQFMPIYSSGLGQPASRYVTRCGTWQEAFAHATAGIDVLLVWGVGNQLAQIPRELLPPRIVLVSHGACRWTQKVIKDNEPFATHYTAVAKAAVEPYPAHLRDRVTVIHNGAEIDRCVPIVGRAETRRMWGIRPDWTLVGYVGRFASEKDPGAVIRAVAKLPSNYYAALIGGGQLEPQLREAARRLIPGRFRFMPWDNRIGDSLAALDCVVVNSEAEGFGNIFVESFLARVPVVCSNVGVIPELEQDHGQLTWRTTYNDPGEGLAKAVLKATGDCGSDEICDRAYDVAWQGFTAPKMGAAWRRYIDTLMERT